MLGLNGLVSLLGALYACCALLLVGYGASTLILLVLYMLRCARQGGPPAAPPPDVWPSVVVQLPIYNEAHVVERLIDGVARLDYPRDRLHVQVLDDSTDETTALIQACAAAHRAHGLNITHLRRPNREGYKAGALAYGLQHTGAEFVAIFDADFLPAPDTLRAMVPHLSASEKVGMVQARWGHLNADTNFLTRVQAFSIDMHFMVEQNARSHAGLMLNFSGSAGLWRRACIEDAGGWQDTTLTEDLDLSYRAQLAGWQCLLLPDVMVPSELPPQLVAYKRQQARWAKGSTQCLRLHGGRILRAQMSPLKKWMALMHLGQYLIQPLLLILVVLAVPLMLSDRLQYMLLSVLGLAGLVPIVAFALSQAALYPRWLPRFLTALPVVVFLGAAMTLNNTIAVGAALLGRPNVFRRTPKFGLRQWQASGYALAADKTVLADLALVLYAGGGAALALAYGKMAALPLFLTYMLACGCMVIWTLWDSRRIREDSAL